MLKKKESRWVCKRCGRQYKAPAAGEIRIEIPVPEWDFCPHDGERREDEHGGNQEMAES